MQLSPIKPDVEQFIEEQVRAGRFATREAVVEAAVEQMMRDQQPHELDDDDAAAINEADAQIDRGEFVEFDVFAAQMKKKYGTS